MIVHRSLAVCALAWALSLSACDAEPAVVVGKAKLTRPSNDAGSRAGNPAAGGGAGREAEDEHDDHDDSEEHDCTEYEPVCGVDGVMYPNACQAEMAGVEIAKPGEC